MSLGEVFVSETVGTGMLILLGAGVVANVLLAKSKGKDGGFLLINFGWGLAVMAGVYVSYKSGAHLNPAVTLGILASGADTYAKGVDVTFGSTLVYFAGQFLGAFIGACLAFVAYRKQFEAEEDEGLKLAVFSTGPEVRSPLWNVLTEVLGTFVLVFVVLSFAKTPSGLGPLAVALLVVGIGASLGGPTGYAINPARDLAPRIAHALLPTGFRASVAERPPVPVGAGGPGAEYAAEADHAGEAERPLHAAKNSDWGYAWVPVVGPVIGGLLAGLLSQVVF
ncbi:MIP/aquaporin family protein [Actinophytocola oryzae]|uniref:Glycerol uptake facilitator protein n=1 Tax=Actinophytocola oryzae TaxID=502181 RepID=A0A4R7W560_9PSEU|nr:MIP/aquaporin family protein [Actinophytocola oryzae]TDV57873.1 glycerol uptake facilitator protein [Actinophytocola oryzae]